MIIVKCGPYAIRAELANMSEALDTARFIRAQNIPNVSDVIPAGNSVLFVIESGTNPRTTEEALRRALDDCTATLPSLGNDSLAPEEIAVGIDYSGPDLPRLARHLNLTEGDTIRWHSTAAWTVRGVADYAGQWQLDRVDAETCEPHIHANVRTVPPGAILFGYGRTGLHRFGGQSAWLHIGTATHSTSSSHPDPINRIATRASIRFIPSHVPNRPTFSTRRPRNPLVVPRHREPQRPTSAYTRPTTTLRPAHIP